MKNYYSDKFPLTQGINPYISILSITFFVIAGLLIGPLLGIFITNLFYDFDINELLNIASGTSMEPESRIPVFLIQGFSSLFGFIIAPILYVILVDRLPFSAITYHHERANLQIILLSIFIVIAFMGVNSIIIEWNQEINFPESLREFEQWATEKEEQARNLTTFLTDFNDFGTFILALIVIAVIPAIGEEVLFRGLGQNKLLAIFKNHHVAIWVSAIIFSVIHFQFYGFVPRMLLGALFGYMYFWSGTLLVPIIAHFVNNGFTIFMIFLYNIDLTEYNIEEETDITFVPVIIFFVLTAFLIYYFRSHFRKQESQEMQ
ncbi:MAG: CPBP family intramembrane glutamic endopeptidase [Candidatus Cyclobacteriaceae bacterium M3_2C_046]